MKKKFDEFIKEARLFFSLLFAFPFATFRWLWAHRSEPNNRAKRRRMERAVRSGIL